MGAPTDGFDYETARNWPIPSVTGAYTRADTIAYARGIGCGAPGALRNREQMFLADGPGLRALPTMVLALNEAPLWTQDPAAGIDWTKTVHAAESLTMQAPLEPEGTLRADQRVIEIYDKGTGKGALMLEERALCDARSGRAIARLEVASFLLGNGGLGGSRERVPAAHEVPADRPPDATIELRTPAAAEAIYALGDEFVGALNLRGLRDGQRVLRGMCAFGVAGRGLLALCCGMDTNRLRTMSLRYAGAMCSDETVVVDVWREQRGEASFQVRAAERDLLLLKNGRVTFDD